MTVLLGFLKDLLLLDSEVTDHLCDLHFFFSFDHGNLIKVRVPIFLQLLDLTSQLSLNFIFFKKAILEHLVVFN